MSSMADMGRAIGNWRRLRDALVARRIGTKVSQQAVADAIGVSCKTVGRWELGYSEPKGTELSQWCAAVGATLEASGPGWGLDMLGGKE